MRTVYAQQPSSREEFTTAFHESLIRAQENGLKTFYLQEMGRPSVPDSEVS